MQRYKLYVFSQCAFDIIFWVNFQWFTKSPVNPTNFGWIFPFNSGTTNYRGSGLGCDDDGPGFATIWGRPQKKLQEINKKPRKIYTPW